jgi:hypothetical protein
MQAQTPEVSGEKATTPAAELRLVSVEQLNKIHRELDACQKAIWLAGCGQRGYGFDPAYVTGAQEQLKQIEAILTAAPAQGQQVGQEPACHRLRNCLGEVITEWKDGPPPEQITDICGVVQTDVTVEVAYTALQPAPAQDVAGQPMQPIVFAERGVIRFKQNAIVRHLLDYASSRGCSLNELARMDFSDDDRMQLAQLIGYSVSGYGDLSYASRESVERADEIADALAANHKQSGGAQ